jgi:dihydrolipoamide dehydrogenase
MSQKFDVVFIGSGPGGYVGAIRAAQLGFNTCVIEKDKTLGGTCLNVGCIPSKALLDSSEHYSVASKEFSEHGIDVEGLKVNLTQMMKRKDKVVSSLTSGIEGLFKKNKITRIQGMGKLLSANQVEVKKADGTKEVVEATNIVLATGSVPNTLPGFLPDGVKIITSTEGIALPSIPSKMVVIGAGAIGLELGSVWSRLGTQVTVVEYADKICGAMDAGLSKKMLTILKKQGMQFVLSAKVTGHRMSGKAVFVDFESLADGSKNTLECDVVLVAAGRKPFSEGLGLEELGIEKDARGFVHVNDHYQTKYPNIFAIGDLTPGPMLAHKAEEEGVAVAELMAGQAGHVNYETCPSVIYTWPEFAAVGLTEEQLKKANVPYRSGEFPFLANGRAKAAGQTDGAVKVLAHAETDKLLGVHIVGPRASDIIAEAVTIMEFGGSAEDMARTFHAHPTFPEALREAALAVDKRVRQF